MMLCMLNHRALLAVTSSVLFHCDQIVSGLRLRASAVDKDEGINTWADSSYTLDACTNYFLLFPPSLPLFLSR